MDNKLYTKIINYIKNNIKFFLFLILLILFLNIKLPWGVYSPGGIINLENRLDDAKFTSNGSFNMTYVTYRNGNIPTLLLSFIIPNWDIVSNDELKMDEETIKEALTRDKLSLKEAISNAYYVAYSKNNIPLDYEESLFIYYLYKEADTNLKIGDKIISINNQKINNFSEIKDIIDNLSINDSISIIVNRNKKEINCYAKIINIDNEKKIGIAISKIKDYKNDNLVNYESKNNESGSSGGLMLALAIYNSLVENDITNGLKISGTGTIDEDGNVGEIAGVKYKLAGAVKNKSDIFLVPTENYEEAIELKKKYNYQINIIEAKTFNGVLNDLNNLNS